MGNNPACFAEAELGCEVEGKPKSKTRPAIKPAGRGFSFNVLSCYSACTVMTGMEGV